MKIEKALLLKCLPHNQLQEELSALLVLDSLQCLYGGSGFSQNGLALSSSSPSSGDKPFLPLYVFRALATVIVIASPVSYLLAPVSRVDFVGVSLRSYQFAVSTPF